MTTTVTINAKIHDYFDESLQYLENLSNKERGHLFLEAAINYYLWKRWELEEKIGHAELCKVESSEMFKTFYSIKEKEEEENAVFLSTQSEVEELKNINKIWIDTGNACLDSEMTDIKIIIPKGLYDVIQFIIKTLEQEENYSVNEMIFNYIMDAIEDFEDIEKVLASKNE